MVIPVAPGDPLAVTRSRPRAGEGRQGEAGATLSVLHSRRTWLPLTETWLYDQIRHLPPDIRNHVVCERRENPEVFASVALTCLAGRLELRWEKALRRLGVLDPLPAYARVVDRTGARILHSHFGDAGWRDSRLAAAFAMVHVVTFYGLDVNHLPTLDPRWVARYQEMFKNAAAILCEGPHMARSVGALGCPPEKIRIHHLGVQVRDIPFRVRRRLPGEPLRILIASSFREKKGIPDGVRAIARVARRLPVQVTIVGDATSEARSRQEKVRIEAALADAQIASDTRLIGFVARDALRRIAMEHDVYLAPSVTASDGDTEGGAPVSILEMMATGMPVVSTTHCDIPELVEHEVTGLLAAEHDVAALAAHLERLADFPERWAEIGHAARRKVEAEFDARVQGESLGTLYRELAGGAR